MPMAILQYILAKQNFKWWAICKKLNTTDCQKKINLENIFNRQKRDIYRKKGVNAINKENIQIIF